MSTAESKVYVITGANRGLGFGFVETLLNRDNVTIFAGVRDVAKATQLNALAEQHKNLHILQLSSGGVEDNKAAAAKVEEIAGRVDVLIANAGIADEWAKVSKASPAEMRRHYEVNVLGPVILLQSFYTLLSTSAQPTFIYLTTGAATLGNMETIPLDTATYGSSKISMNFITRKLHFEEPKFISFALAPGWVQTDMGNAGAASVGMEKAPLTVKQSVDGMLGVIDTATRETRGGMSVDYDGSDLAW